MDASFSLIQELLYIYDIHKKYGKLNIEKNRTCIPFDFSPAVRTKYDFSPAVRKSTQFIPFKWAFHVDFGLGEPRLHICEKERSQWSKMESWPTAAPE